MTYRYHRIGKYLVCLDQSIYDAVKTVALGHDRYKLRSIGVSKNVGRKAAVIVARGKFGLLNSAQQMLLPAFGNIAMRVHRGFKVFDFNKLEVTKVFDQGTPSDIATQELAASKQASEVGAAPRFIAEDPGLAWYREEYVCGVHATDAEFRAGAEIMDFYSDVERCLLDLVSCKPAINVNAVSHINRHADISFRDRWLDAGLDLKNVDEIAAYVERMQEWLLAQSKPDQLQLVLTHGDFSLVNAISTSAGLRFVDWEGVARGGLYSDIFHFLFAEKYYDRASANFAKDMSVYIEKYRKSIQARFPELRTAAEIDLTFARRQYYLERLSLLLDRDVSSNLCKVVSNSIAMFRDFDRDAGDSVI